MNILKITSLAIAIAAFAAGCDTMSPTKRLRGDSPSAATSQRSEHATTYWTQNARDGYMSRQSAMGYSPADGRAMDFSRVDTDNGRQISEREWNAYHAAIEVDVLLLLVPQRRVGGELQRR